MSHCQVYRRGTLSLPHGQSSSSSSSTTFFSLDPWESIGSLSIYLGTPLKWSANPVEGQPYSNIFKPCVLLIQEYPKITELVKKKHDGWSKNPMYLIKSYKINIKSSFVRMNWNHLFSRVKPCQTIGFIGIPSLTAAISGVLLHGTSIATITATGCGASTAAAAAGGELAETAGDQLVGLGGEAFLGWLIIDGS